MKIRFGDMVDGYSRKFPGEDMTALEPLKDWTVTLTVRDGSDEQPTVYVAFEPPHEHDTIRKETRYGNQDRLEEEADFP